MQEILQSDLVFDVAKKLKIDSTFDSIFNPIITFFDRKSYIWGEQIQKHLINAIPTKNSLRVKKRVDFIANLADVLHDASSIDITGSKLDYTHSQSSMTPIL